MSKVNVINLGMVNCFLLEDEGLVLVDTGTKTHGQQILSAITALGVDPKEIKLIILTHNHSDHVGSLSELVSATGAKTLMQKLDYETSKGMIKADIVPYAWIAKLMMAMTSKTDKPQIDSDLTIDILMVDEFDLTPYGIKGKVIHTPGHSKGSVSVLLQDGQVLIGDSLMAMFSKKTPGRPMLAYDLTVLKESIEMLMNRGAEKFYLSHGKVYDKVDIQKALTTF